MSGILNKLGLSHHDAASSSSSSSTTSSSTHSTHSGTTAAHGTNLAGASTSTINKTGYADSANYAHTTGVAGTTGYGTESTTTTTTTTTAGHTAAHGTVAANAGAADYMTRSEERLLVGKEQVSAGVASLNKYVTTEHVSTAVPITKEHVVIEREPIAPGEAIRGDIKEAHYEVALSEERAVAAKEAVAVEKVKLRKEVEHAVQNVDADLRKEHIEFGTTNETGKVLGAAPGTAGYTQSSTTTTTGSNIDPLANPRV